MARERLISIDATKGIAIFLVVLGHIVARDMPVGDTWFFWVKATIYKFHMPLFMFVTGLVYGYGRKPIATLADYRRHVVQKTKRLMPAWLLFALIMFVGKYVGRRFFFVDNQIVDPSEFFRIVTAPILSFASFLWYVYVIYLYYLLEPLVYVVTRGRLLYFLPVALALYFVPSTPAFGNDLLMQYAFVFFLGIWCGDNYLLFHRLTRRFGLLLLGLFVIALPVAVTWHVPKLAMGLLAILGVTWLAELPAVKDNSLIQMFATYTFAIYLMNTLCIGLTKAVLLHVVPWSNTGFLVLGPCLLLAGMFLPILIRRYVISRSRVLSYIIA